MSNNAQKLREALVQVQKKINYLIGNLTVPNSLVANRMEINGIINAAISAPPRNCDVGSADELYRRFKSYCDDNVAHDKLYCQTTCCSLCVMEWMQMPYDKEAK